MTLDCYRSSQPDAPTLEREINQYHLKSVINLRGICKGSWLSNETAVCNRMGVELHDVKVDPVRLPRPSELHDLIVALDSAPKPMLLHCRNGCDRTAFASVLELVLEKNEPLASAIQHEMSLASGHIRTANNDAGDRFFELYDQSQQGRPARKTVREWIEKDYPAIYDKLGPYGGVNGGVQPRKAAESENDSD